MASASDKAHFRAIAEYETAANEDSLREDALRSPGRNIELGIELSDFTRRAAQQMEARPADEPPTAPIAIWRALQARRKDAQSDR
jgi:hypothetical protein